MTPEITDSHCHLDFPQFEDRAEVTARAKRRGVERFVTICTRVRQFHRLQALIDAEPDVFAPVGPPPHHAHDERHVPVVRRVPKR